MLPLLTTVLAVAVTCATAQSTHYKYGPTWGFRTYKSKGFITSLETTLIAGAPPSPAQARLALWPGMDTAKGLVQPIIVSSDEALYLGRSCGGATKEDWCVFASMIVGTSQQKMGKRVPLKGTDELLMKFTWNETLGGYDQYLFINSKPVSELHYPSGKSSSFYVDTECQAKHDGIVNAHKYINSKIVLSEANPTWGKNPSMHYMACADESKTADGGKTWDIPNIWVQESRAPRDFKTGGSGAGPTVWCPGGPAIAKGT